MTTIALSLLYLLSTWLAGPVAFGGQPQTAAIRPPAAILVELFTSEGCSSCPPADQLLRRINGTRTSDGRLIIGLSEHVTYWNRLGWADPYSADNYTQRQNDYAGRFRLDSVYTPQMVIDGREQIVGSDSSALAQALNEEADRTPVDLRIVVGKIEQDALVIRFTLAPNKDSAPLNIVAVVADDTDRSNVLRGENAGRVLGHVSVARFMERVATVQGASDRTLRIALPKGFSVNPQTGHHLILFAQRGDSGPVFGTDSAPI